jgi:hypothetical protein
MLVEYTRAVKGVKREKCEKQSLTFGAGVDETVTENLNIRREADCGPEQVCGR